MMTLPTVEMLNYNLLFFFTCFCSFSLRRHIDLVHNIITV